MSTATKTPRAEVLAIACELKNYLAPHCERIEIAGSLRRGVAMVGDIELVYIPKVDWKVDLFGGQAEVGRNHVDQALSGKVWPRETGRYGRLWGDRYKAGQLAGYAVDLFAVFDRAEWGLLLLLRTGPAEFSQRFVTPVRKGGWLPDGCRVDGRRLWRDGVPLDLPEEVDCFKAIGRAYVPPGVRR